MPSYKSDSSFFHKIAVGAIGSRTVKQDLASRGHCTIELERGSLDAKIWNGVKRKRVRIPDLVCRNCGQRIEVRTKTKPKISMSHSPTIPERRWDYGMVETDLVAIPICAEGNQSGDKNSHWTRGILADDISYWNEKEWVKWEPDGATNYFTVRAFRNAPPDKTERKGAEEGSETTLIWNSCFSPCNGSVVSISAANITVEGADGVSRRRGRKNMTEWVAIGDSVRRNQILACNVEPASDHQLQCPGGLTNASIMSMLGSVHLPVRFAGVKLARVRNMSGLLDHISAIANNRDEDIYVRLEAKAYLAQIHGEPIAGLFSADLSALDKADQLEAVIAIGEVGTEDAAILLSGILGDQTKDYFLRSASAYCLGRIDSVTSRTALVQAFAAQTYRVREDALAALVDVGFDAMAELLSGIDANNEEVQAGCAEVLRLIALRSDTATVGSRLVPQVASLLATEDRSLIAVWLGGQLPEPLMRAALGEVLDRDARLAYTLAVLWAFARSWIAPQYDSFQQPGQ